MQQTKGASNQATPGAEPAPAQKVAEGQAPQVGEILTRIRCIDDYEAIVFCVGLQAPDGLAFNARGELVVVEETAGQVTRITSDGKHVVIASNLRSPEGIALDFSGAGSRFMVVEDLLAGRLASIELEQDDSGNVETEKNVTEHSVTFHDFTFDACEGVLVHGDTLYITDSNAQLVENIFSARTRLLALPREKAGWGKPRVILERSFPFSFSELIADGDHYLILANEFACSFVPEGLLRLDLRSGIIKTFATELVSPEGLCRTPFDETTDNPQRGFPLFVAEENYDGEGHGRLSRIDEQGKRTTFAIGFETLEDVLVAEDGRIFVSEDCTGMVIELRPKAPQPSTPAQE